ncbi:hypothetical protein BBOV_III010340 [Babesia bovis T2Bo]|uniref:Uncharacterized protein n=1 Tax=Babesia bovis TaxID=5865 RepID=A7APV5_BABBO|nr:hypothetical protein BBOV_III010340 [Babesia bovis T2Bo]EDO08589.1 hypothetical protein BBOV_III010340 [Babesia bovis T2Bo]|eukprot:XP_001612157.1 hypothetical protein [Babesia bovis T2Bo]
MAGMFRCRVCSFVPIAKLLGLYDPEEEEESRVIRRRDSFDSAVSPSVDDRLSTCSAADREGNQAPRSAEEISYLVKSWDTYVHQRAKSLWNDAAKRYAILGSIARGCPRCDDPVVGSDSVCVRWQGAVEDGYPVIPISSDGKSTGKTSFVTRLLAFLFADEQSYEIIENIPYRAFRMACGDKLCITLTHIRLD